MLQDNFDIFNSKFTSGLWKDLEPPDNVDMFESPGFKIPLKLKECEADGMSWVADFIAFRMKKIQNLGTYVFNATSKHTKNKLRTLMNRHSVQIHKSH